MPIYRGEVTQISRIKFCVEAESEQDAKDLVFSSYIEDAVLVTADASEEVIGEIEEAETYLVDKAQRGNIRQRGVDDFWVEKDK